MTKSKKALIAGAALAGLLVGTSPAIHASNLLSGIHGAGLQSDQKADDSKVKEKHACKGQNSCKGNGGCKSSDNGCKGKNSCKGKGGCKASDNGCKAKNSCKGKGGCATDGSKPKT